MKLGGIEHIKIARNLLGEITKSKKINPLLGGCRAEKSR